MLLNTGMRITTTGIGVLGVGLEPCGAARPTHCKTGTAQPFERVWGKFGKFGGFGKRGEEHQCPDHVERAHPQGTQEAG